MNLPRCCGGPMQIHARTEKFIELACARCGDVAYLKNDDLHDFAE